MIYITTDAVLTYVNICKLQSSKLTVHIMTGGNGRDGALKLLTVMQMALWWILLSYHITVICDPSLSINLFRSIKSFHVLIRSARLFVITRGVQCHYEIYVHVTEYPNKFLYNKTNQMHQFPKFTPAWNTNCFGQFLCPSSGVYLLYTRH
jgi:hypothetical protein